MSSFLQCPSCQSEVEVGEQSINQKVVCPKCSQVIIQEKPTEEEITLTPITMDQSPANAAPPHTETTDNRNLSNSREDNFVLNSLETFKVINIVVCFILCTIQFISMMGCLADHHGTAFFAVPLFFGMLITIYVSFLIHLAICWGRGVYRNLAWLRVITDKIPENKY